MAFDRAFALKLAVVLAFAVAIGYGFALMGHPNSVWTYCTVLRWC